MGGWLNAVDGGRSCHPGCTDTPCQPHFPTCVGVEHGGCRAPLRGVVALLYALPERLSCCCSGGGGGTGGGGGRARRHCTARQGGGSWFDLMAHG